MPGKPRRSAEGHIAGDLIDLLSGVMRFDDAAGFALDDALRGFDAFLRQIELADDVMSRTILRAARRRIVVDDDVALLVQQRDFCRSQSALLQGLP